MPRRSHCRVRRAAALRAFGVALAISAALLIAGCGGESSDGLQVTGSSPSNGTSAADLSLTTVSATFNHDVATTFDGINFIWPHLSTVQSYLSLEDPVNMVPVPYFLDYDAGSKALVLYLSEPPVAGAVYRLTLLQGLPTEDGLTLGSTRVIQFSLGQPSFGGGVYANRVVAYAPELPGGESNGSGFYVSASALGAPKGALHVVSLGDDGSGEGGSITLGFGDGLPGNGGTPWCIEDGAGADFRVHENVFAFTDPSGPANFTEAAYVEVSADNSTWYRFPATGPATANDVDDPANYTGLAGVMVGGDDFDLADVIAQYTLGAGYQACYVRIVDGGAAVLDYDGSGEWGTMSPSGADIDAVEVLNGVEAPAQSP